MYYIIGIILGLLNFIDFGAFGLGEFCLIIVLFLMSVGKNKSIKKEKNFYLKNDLLKIFIYIIFLFGYFIWSNVNYNFIVKSIIKWITILLEIYLICKALGKNEKTINMLITFMLFSKLAEYHNFNSIYALHYFFIIPIFNLLYIKHNKKTYKYMLYIVCIIYFLFGKSRSALVLLMLYIACDWANYIFTNLKSGNSNKKIISIIILIAFLVGGFLSFKFVEKNVNESTESNNERRILIQIVMEEFRKEPLLGVGPVNFNNYAQNHLGYRLRNNLLTPHNLYLEILCENGIIGLIIFLNIIKIIFKSLKCKNVKTPIKFGAIYILAYYMFSTFTGTNRVVFTILYSIVVYNYYEQLRGSLNEKNFNNSSNV